LTKVFFFGYESRKIEYIQQPSSLKLKPTLLKIDANIKQFQTFALCLRTYLQGIKNANL